MKKISFLLSLIIFSFLFHSCQKEEFTPNQESSIKPSYDLTPIDPAAYDRSSIQSVLAYMDPVFLDWINENNPEAPIGLIGKIVDQLPRRDEGYKRAKCTISDHLCVIIVTGEGGGATGQSNLATEYGYNPTAMTDFHDLVIMCWPEKPALVQGHFSSLLINPENHIEHFVLNDPAGNLVADWINEELNVIE